MVARFSTMISSLRAHNKIGSSFCETPANRLGINVLRLLREQGLIQGFSLVSPRKKTARLFPRVRIYFKYSDVSNPALTDIKLFKNTSSNFTNIQRHRRFHTISQRKLYILSTTSGLRLTSLADYLQTKRATFTPTFSGKVLVEIST